MIENGTYVAVDATRLDNLRMESSSRHDVLRPFVAAVAFALAAAALLWPIHFRAADGASVFGATDQFTLSSSSMRTCPGLIQLGHGSSFRALPPANSDATFYLVDSYNAGVCAAKRSERTSDGLVLVVIGFGFTISTIRRRADSAQIARMPEPAPAQIRVLQPGSGTAPIRH